MSKNRDMLLGLLGGIIAHITIGVMMIQGNLTLETLTLGIVMYSLTALYVGFRFVNEEKQDKAKHYYGEPESKGIMEALEQYEKSKKGQ